MARLFGGFPGHTVSMTANWAASLSLERIGQLRVTALGRWTSLLSGGPPAVTLQTATGGDPSRSRLWTGLLRRYGVADVLSTFADSYGCWGWLDLWRTLDQGQFTELETKHLAMAAPTIAAGLRRSRADRMRRDARSRRDDAGHPTAGAPRPLTG